MKKILKISIGALCVFCALALTLDPSKFIGSCLDGIKLWCFKVLPALLPFFFLTTLLNRLGLTASFARVFKLPCEKIFKVPGICSYAFISSALSGYPVGAKTIADLYEKKALTKEQAAKAATFCSTSGPSFVVGAIGYGAFASGVVGSKILVCHLLAALICGAIFGLSSKEKCLDAPRFILDEKAENVLYECVYSAVVSVAVVGGFICIFNVFADILTKYGVTNILSKPPTILLKDQKLSAAIINGLIECTRGATSLAALGTNAVTVSWTCAIISFGGISVLAQSLAFLSKANVKPTVFLLAKVTHGAIAFALCYLTY